MKTVLLLRQRMVVRSGTFTEIVIWRVPRRVPASSHPYKYRMALIDGGTCVLRYDNETGKGDHRHFGGRQESYRFVSIEQLLDDFDENVRRYLDAHPDHR